MISCFTRIETPDLHDLHRKTFYNAKKEATMKDKMLKFAILVLGLSALPCLALTGFDPDYDAALGRAKASGRQMFVLFTGSDWCHWCKQLEAEVFSKREFLDFATNEYELVVLDYPMKKKQPKERKNRNRELSSKFDVKGFPTVLLISADEKVVYQAGYEEGGAAKWVESFRKGVSLKPLFDEHLASFEKKAKDVMDRMRTEFFSNRKSLSEDARKMAEFLKATAVKYLSEVAELEKELEAKDVPAELEDSKLEIKEHLEKMREGLEEQSKIDIDEFVANMEKAKNAAQKGKEPTRFTMPRPEDAKVDVEYYEKVAMPFWRKHLVDGFRPPEGMDEKTARRVVGIREALARKLATARCEFPTGAEFNEASDLWKKAKCRDVAVALVRYLGLSDEDRYWQGNKMFKGLVSVHDNESEPVLGYLLRWGQAHWADVKLRLDKNAKMKDMQSIWDENAKAFEKVAPIFKGEDCRILETLHQISTVGRNAGKLIGDEYLELCIGGGESNLLAAVEIRPNGALAMMKLARHYGFGCGGDGAIWFNRAVSNSLDTAATVGLDLVLRGQTTRWGGSAEYLYSVASNAAANVRTDSPFSYRVAATALANIYRWEVEDVPSETNIVAYVVKPELRESLYAMFEKYIAAGEQPLMPPVDVFRGMALALAMQLNDWDRVRRYASQIKGSFTNWQDAHWLRIASPNGEYLEQINMFTSIGDKRTREDAINLGEAFCKGDMQTVMESAGNLMKMKKLPESTYAVASQLYFKARKAIQEAAGGWVDAMPTVKGFEANHWWGWVHLYPDGLARNDSKGARSYYRILTPLPGIGYEYEATVHFEEKDPNQKYWNIGWGFSHPYVGLCMQSNSWAMPYIRFWRDDDGDHYHIESYTKENLEKANGYKTTPEEKKSNDEGWTRLFLVKKGDLQKQPTHAFSLKADEKMLAITIDGETVFSVPMDEMMEIGRYCERIKPDGCVYPVWKVFKNTAFSNYRYRKIPENEN